MILRMVMMIMGTALITTVSAQQPTRSEQRIAARIARHDLGHKENNVFLTMASGIASDNQFVSTFKIEYSRQVKGNLYWGAGLGMHAYLNNPLMYTFEESSESGPLRYTTGQNLLKFNGMIFYRLPVIQSRLFFRVGAGVGVGFHSIIYSGDMYSRDENVLPFLNLEAAWILRVARGFELKFSPTILIIPSEFSISPIKFDSSTNIIPWLADAGLSLTLGWRF